MKGKKKIDRPLLMWEVIEQENNRWIKENWQIDTDINQDEIEMETAEPSDDLRIELLGYQKEWLFWALRQEGCNGVRGGILADEMGMGKTLQVIALVLYKRSILQGIPEHQLPSSSASSSRDLPPIKGTLVICPLVAVSHWRGEIDRFTSKGSIKVLVYHGANRANNLNQLSDYDFVITTYSTLVAEFRKYTMPPKDKCQNCGNLFDAHNLKIHLKTTCRLWTFEQAKQQKEQPKSKKMPDLEVHTSKINREDESNNGSVLKEMENDYSTVSLDVTGLISLERKSILHCVAWERIAHNIKKRSSNKTRAVLALQSKYRWALSGTPLQNRVGELYVLICFLWVVPYSYYFCEVCNCHTLDYSASPKCPECDHDHERHFCWWNKYVSRPIQRSARMKEAGRGAMLLLKHKILKSLVLRRMKKGRIAELQLPSRTVTLRRDSLDAVEEDYYTALYNEGQTQFNAYSEAGTLMDNYANIIDLLTRLRKAVNHPYLVEFSVTSMERKGKTFYTNKDLKCVLCEEPAEDSVVTACRHVICKPCWDDFTHDTSMDQYSCPYCSKPTSDFITKKDGKQQRSKTTIEGFRPSSILNRIDLDKFQTSTKIDALMEEIRFMVERDGSAKAVVFSQFPCFLDLIHYALLKTGVHCVQLDGSKSMRARDAAIGKFTEDPTCRIFLASLKAGGVALNLTVASHVFLMDPWWNRTLELQAEDRIYRIGQHKPVRVVEFIIDNTIEERILKLQEKKESIVLGTVGGCLEALEKVATQESDLRFLFVT